MDKDDDCLTDGEGNPIMCQKCNKELSVKNLIEQHLCYVRKCEQCQAMFSNEEDYTKHNRNCNTFEAIEEEGVVDRCVEIVGIMDDEKYKNIPRNTWPELFRLGAEAFRAQQTKTMKK